MTTELTAKMVLDRISGEKKWGHLKGMYGDRGELIGGDDGDILGGFIVRLVGDYFREYEALSFDGADMLCELEGMLEQAALDLDVARAVVHEMIEDWEGR